MTGLSPEYLDRATPADVDVTDRVRTRYPDPTMGVPLPDAGAATAAHPLVTVGDSLTHGMSSGAVSRGETRTTGNAAPVRLHRRPPSGSPTSGSTAGTCVTACRTPQASPRPGSRRRRPTTTCSGPSRPTTATSQRAPSSARSGRPRPRSTPPAGSARTAASARWSWRTGRTTRCARSSTRTRSGLTPATTRWTERTDTPFGDPRTSRSSTAASSTPSALSTPTACCWRRCRT